MNTPLNFVDLLALSPLWIILFAALTLLLLETFAEKTAKKLSFFVTLIALIFVLFAGYFAPVSQNPLFTPWLRFDHFTRFFILLFSGIGIASTLLAASFFQRFDTTRGEYYFLLLSAIFGLILIGSSADFLTLFLGLETLSIPLYILCGYMKKWETSPEAAIKYFFIGSIATAFLLYGVALIYGAVGSTQLLGLKEHYQALTSSTHHSLFMGGIAFITLGLAFKAAIVPFHVWAPDVYDGASHPVTAFMAVGTKAGAFAAFAVIFLFALPQFNPIWNQVMSGLAIITMIYANIVALRQVQLRRFFAYSGISHAGFLLIPMIANTSESMSALAFYLIIYALATIGCFAVLAFLDHQTKGVFLSDLQGLFKRSPWLAGMLTLCLLTLAGIPPTAGFFAKFYVFKLAFQVGDYALLIVGLLTTILSVFYYLRIVSMMFSNEPADHIFPSASWPAAILAAFSFIAILFVSFYPESLLNLMTAVR